MVKPIEFRLNHKPVRLEADRDRKLLWVLRTDLGLTGPKYGCGEGLCGACTVIIGGKAVRSCSLPLGAAEGKEILTIEGLASNGRLHPLQKAFVELSAFQCGFCAPGMILNAYSFLTENPEPSEAQIRSAMEENLCRCAAHIRIVKAIMTASREMKGGR